MINEYYCTCCLTHKPAREFTKKTEGRKVCDHCHEVHIAHRKQASEEKERKFAGVRGFDFEAKTPVCKNASKEASSEKACNVRNRLADIRAAKEIEEFVGVVTHFTEIITDRV